MKTRRLNKVQKYAEYLGDIQEKLLVLRDEEQADFETLDDEQREHDAADTLQHAIDTLESAADELGEVIKKLNSIEEDE